MESLVGSVMKQMDRKVFPSREETLDLEMPSDSVLVCAFWNYLLFLWSRVAAGMFLHQQLWLCCSSFTLCLKRKVVQSCPGSQPSCLMLSCCFCFLACYFSLKS